jgi:RNA recognition motif-containing protein
MAVRLFVGNLAYDVTEADVRAHFAAVGPLSSLYLPMDRTTGKPRGFAFVEFSTRANAEDAMRRLHQQAFQSRRRAPRNSRGPKRPMPKRPTGPVRFGTEEDNGDEEDVDGEYTASRREDAVERTSLHRRPAAVRDRGMER